MAFTTHLKGESIGGEAYLDLSNFHPNVDDGLPVKWVTFLQVVPKQKKPNASILVFFPSDA